MPFKSIRYAPGTVQDWGFQARRINQVEERDRLPDEAAAVARARPRRLLGVALCQPRRPRSAAAVAHARAQAVRHRRSHDRQRRRRPAARQRPERRRRRRREVQHHAEPHRRPHLQHRLRAGGSRRAAGEPHALQPVLPGEARLLPREPGAVHVRQQQLLGRRSAATSDLPLLFYSRRIGLAGSREVPILGGGRADRPHRPLLSSGSSNMQTRDDAAAARDAGHQLLGRAREARHPAPSSIGVLATSRSKAQTLPGSNQVVRRRRHVRVLQQPDVRHLPARRASPTGSTDATT